jgi:TetR/AcrR family transcriptional regulator
VDQILPAAKKKGVRKKARPRVARAKQQRSVDTRRRIIDAAIKEFAANGYEGTSTRTIAERSKVQHTLVTYHFKGKEGLWRGAIADILAVHRAEFDQRLHGLRGVDDVTKLRILQEEFIRFSFTNQDFHRIMGHMARTPSDQLDWLIDEYLRKPSDLRASLIRSAQAQGKYVEGDPYHLHYIFIGAVTRIFLLSAEAERFLEHSLSSPEFMEEHVRVCLGLFFR